MQMLNWNSRTPTEPYAHFHSVCVCRRLNLIETSKIGAANLHCLNVLLACSFFHSLWKLNEAFSFNELSLGLLLLRSVFFVRIVSSMRASSPSSACTQQRVVICRQTIQRKLIGYKLYRMPHYSMSFFIRSPSRLPRSLKWQAFDQQLTRVTRN